MLHVVTVAAKLRSLKRRLGAPPLRIPILYYHEIGSEPDKNVVHPDAFADQISWLVESGFDALSLDDVANVYAGTRAVPARPVAITFDDGRAGALRYAAPVLQRQRLPATVYVVTRWADGREVPERERYSDFLDWKQIKELRAAGLWIGSHTVTHCNLKRVPREDVHEEVRASRQHLQDRLGEDVVHFSFPKGRAPRHAVAAVRSAGYRTAVVTGQRWNGRFADLHRLNRLRVNGREGLAEFRRLLAADPAGSQQA